MFSNKEGSNLFGEGGVRQIIVEVSLTRWCMLVWQGKVRGHPWHGLMLGPVVVGKGLVVGIRVLNRS